jgi:hypothetical protein
MADSRIQHEAEQWVVDQALPAMFGQPFAKRRLKLEWGGVFEFDGVSEDQRIVTCVSTSAGRTASGKNPSGKIVKIKADTLYLLAATAERRLLVFTERLMMNMFEREQASGRFPPSIELVLISLPEELQARLDVTRALASSEVSSGKASL